MKVIIFLFIALFLFACSSAGPKTGTGSLDNKLDERHASSSDLGTGSRPSQAASADRAPSDQRSVRSLNEKTPLPRFAERSHGQYPDKNAFSSSSAKDEDIDEYQSESSLVEQSEDKPDQAIFDSALEFCETSSDLWDQGDLDGAISALDQAYALILTVDVKRSPELLQQVEDLRFTISKRIVEIYSSRHTAVNGYHTAIPMVMNRRVEDALNQLKGPERNFFINAYQRSGKYRPAIVKALKEAGLPEELSWLPLIESGFKVRALSTARALGLWQFIASTGYKYGLKRGTWVDERMDPEKSTKAAIEYLKELHQIFGDWTTALAAYNCGEGAVLRFLKTQRINYLDNFWDLYEKLPRETASYVPRFLATLHIMANPEAHGFQLPQPEEAIPLEKVTVDRVIHLQTIAASLSLSYDVLVELNPELRQDATPDRPYDIRVPAGTGLILLSKVNEMPGWSPPPVQRYRTHKVAKGETVYSIARKYKTTTGAIISLNKLGKGPSTRLSAGTELKIPTGKRQWNTQEAKAGKTSPGQKDSCPATYKVKKGDTLSSIAARFNTTISRLKGLNGIKDANLKIGQVILLSETNITKKDAPKPVTYKVVKGDSPHSIAVKNDISLKQLLRLNNLRADGTIYPGQVLVVKAE